MKILLVNDFENKSRGAEIYNYNLKELLRKRGHEVKIFTGDDHEEDSLRTYFSSWYNLRKKKEISNILDDFKPDVVQCHNLFGYVSPSILYEIKKRNTSLIMKIGDMRLLCPRNDLMLKNKEVCKYGYSTKCITSGCFLSRPRLKKKLHSIMYLGKIALHRLLIRKYVDAFIAPSEFSGSFLKENAGFEPMIIIRNPIFWERSVSKNFKSGKKKKILFVGNLTKRKGIENVIQAFDILRSNFNNVKLEIIGEGEEKESLIRFVNSKGLTNHITFRYNTPHEKLKQKYRDTDVFVLPSTIAENSPLTIMEAMSQGTPVITTNIGGQKELVRDGYNGFLVEPGNSEDLAEKIKIILQDEELRRKMSKNCLKEARKFSPEEHIKKIEYLFQLMIRGGKH